MYVYLYIYIYICIYVSHNYPLLISYHIMFQHIHETFSVQMDLTPQQLVVSFQFL